MRKQLETWVPVGALVLSLVGATWVIRGEIADVGTELVALEGRMDSRISAVEAKLDLLISGLNIEVSEAGE